MESGTRLGPYEIVEQLGAGGMGEVYRARDSRLERDVAIKVLPEDFASDSERLARFEREAKLLASLSHPHIATIYGFEESDGIRFIAMECVEGTTLAQKIEAEGRVDVDEVLEIARQIAEALEAAHDSGVIHRDLKPANIKVTREGQVKVLDFGLAKAYQSEGLRSGISQDLSHSPTMAATLTGVIMGTAAYMSPEQARGKPVDRRTDIWAYGCVLYEMLAGRRAFGGQTVSDTLAAILKEEPDWAVLPNETPRAVRRLLRRCLQRGLNERLHDVADARLDLNDAAVGLGADPATLRGASDNDGAARRARLLTPAALVGVLLAVVAAYGWLRPAPSDTASVTRLPLALTEPSREINEWGLALAISPDGSKFAYHGRDRTWWVRAFGSLEAVEIETAALAQDFIFSPDGQSIAYRQGNWIGSLTVETLARDRRDKVFESALGFGLDWSSDGWIYFTSSIDLGLGRVSADGARSESLTKLDQSANEFQHGFPDALPGGAAVLFTIGYTNRANIEDTQIAVLDLATGEVKKLVRGLRPRFVDSGHLVFVRADGAVMAVAFDPESLEFEGTPVQVAGAANVGAFGKQADLDATLAGTLIYVSASPEPVDDLVWISRSGAVERTDSSWEGRPRFPSLSADGGYLAAMVHRGRLPPNVWLKQLPDGHLRRLTHGNSLDYRPRWTSDGTAIVHVGPRPPDRVSWDMYQTDITTGVESRVLEEGEIVDASWSRDGQWIVYSDRGGLFAAREGALDSLLPLSASPVFSESDPELSPDGQWLAFESDESGSREVWVQPFPEADGNRQQVSPSGGREPLWANSGRELFYVNAAGQLVSAELASGATFEIREHRVLFSVADYLWAWGYDVTRDDDQFIFIRRGPTLAPVILVQNLAEELKRLVLPEP